ncbi:putative outer membrane lipoprotein [Variovorax boronicumulans]|uniref:Outer membrane lipoprotein n=1 Tax=Variovorax boronicumulans TaxID=436515 RepID=A0AAW8CTT2_9BURK|nr:hypothetical protein [Variovorax boronicumulans]MDP9892686.1 putative outer membrane lipoprotein [Variovorax boronicumulans]MDQ0051833.1 putative outer membrane lipoprotein [Variovorax boronicumulans]
MFIREEGYARLHRSAVAKSRAHINLDGQKQWPTNRSGARGISIPNGTAFAQNEAYLELCNSGWNLQWRAGIGNLYVILPALFVIWFWYGMTIHPVLFGQLIFLWYPTSEFDNGDLIFGWVLGFPLALASAFLIYMWFCKMGMRTCFFTSARGRIRFNRLTRKVYVLRPKYCGGNAVFEWDRLVALFDPQSTNRWDKQDVAMLALYHPPFDATDPAAQGEDCLFAGPAVTGPEGAAHLWEYIRQYMETGPTIDRIPPGAPANFKGIARYLHPEYTTYCGLSSSYQYRQECRPGFMETFFHMSSQITCSWPRFPKEWQSDSGMGEPEDRPVQTGAVMTALVYRARGQLSKAEEVELMERYGTAEALAAAKARRD